MGCQGVMTWTKATTNPAGIDPGTERRAAAGRILLVGTLLAGLALLVWLGRNSIPSWFATSHTTDIWLTWWDEQDDARVKRAFATAKRSLATDAVLEFDSAQLKHIRNGIVHVPALSAADSIAAAKAFSAAMVSTFNVEGSGRLDNELRRQGRGVPNPLLLAILPFCSLGLFLAAIPLMWVGARGMKLGGSEPFLVWFIPASLGFFYVFFLLPSWLFMACFAMFIPCAIAATIVYKIQQARRAAAWPSTQGRIVRSESKAVKRQQMEDPTKVSTVPLVEYVFSVGGTEYRSRRIRIGKIADSSSEVDAVLERYRIGRTLPVFYNPDNPKEAVLERDLPASAPFMYAIAGGVVLVGLAVVVMFTRVSQVVGLLQPYFPPGAFVPGVLFCVLACVLLALITVFNYRAALAAMRWPHTEARILSSVAESRRVLTHQGGGNTMIVWSPVVEYSYQVNGRDHYSSRISFGADFAADRALAEKTVARYPAGSVATVYYDPANPSSAVLEPRVAFAWPTLLLVAGFFAAAIFFSGWRM
jgi:hypothetical protein